MILQLKIHTAGKMFGKICSKAIRDTFFSNMRFDIQQLGVIYNRRGMFKTFGLAGRGPANSLH